MAITRLQRQQCLGGLEIGAAAGLDRQADALGMGQQCLQFVLFDPAGDVHKVIV